MPAPKGNICDCPLTQGAEDVLETALGEGRIKASRHHDNTESHASASRNADKSAFETEHMALSQEVCGA